MARISVNSARREVRMRKNNDAQVVVVLLIAFIGSAGVQAETLSDPAITSENITLAATGEATVQVTAHKQIATSTYAGSHLLGSWSASVTSGTVAWRLNPTTVQQYATPDYVNGFVKSTTDNTKQIEVSLTTDTACSANQLSGEWRHCPEGVTAVSGTITTVAGKNQLLAPGTYPVAIDAAVWSF
jgi:Tfp pilus assembly protein PilV